MLCCSVHVCLLLLLQLRKAAGGGRADDDEQADDAVLGSDDSDKVIRQCARGLRRRCTASAPALL
jgi:hypothetical protein